MKFNRRARREKELGRISQQIHYLGYDDVTQYSTDIAQRIDDTVKDLIADIAAISAWGNAIAENVADYTHGNPAKIEELLQEVEKYSSEHWQQIDPIRAYLNSRSEAEQRLSELEAQSS